MVFNVLYSVIILLCALGFVWLARSIARGEADEFIAGYNTSSPEEKAQYNILRLRRVISVMLYGIAVLLLLLCTIAFLDEKQAMIVTLIIVAIIVVWAVALGVWGIKWARK